MRIPAVAFVAFVAFAAALHADTVKVPGDFTTIQQGVDGAANGDTIVVSKGTYAEDVVISGRSNLTLKAKGKVNITGGGGPNALLIDTSDHIEVKGFTISGGTARRVLMSVAADSRLTKCTIDGGSSEGIRVSDCQRVQVDKNKVSGQDGYGIRVEFVPPFAPLSTAGAVDSDFVKNRVSDTGDSGILLQGLNCRLTKNRVERAGGNGIEILGPATSTKNRVTDADVNGIFVNTPDAVLVKDKSTHSGDDGFELKGSNGSLEKCSSTRSIGDGFTIEVGISGYHLTKCKAKQSGADGFGVLGPTNVLEKCVATKTGALGLNDPAGGATTNTYTNCKFDSTNLPGPERCGRRTATSRSPLSFPTRRAAESARSARTTSPARGRRR